MCDFISIIKWFFDIVKYLFENGAPIDHWAIAKSGSNVEIRDYLIFMGAPYDYILLNNKETELDLSKYRIIKKIKK